MNYSIYMASLGETLFKTLNILKVKINKIVIKSIFSIKLKLYFLFLKGFSMKK